MSMKKSDLDIFDVARVEISEIGQYKDEYTDIWSSFTIQIFDYAGNYQHIRLYSGRHKSLTLELLPKVVLIKRKGVKLQCVAL